MYCKKKKRKKHSPEIYNFATNQEHIGIMKKKIIKFWNKRSTFRTHRLKKMGIFGQAITNTNPISGSLETKEEGTKIGAFKAGGPA